MQKGIAKKILQVCFGLSLLFVFSFLFMLKIKVLQQAGVQQLHYHTFGDKRASLLPEMVAALRTLTVAALWRLTKVARGFFFVAFFKNI